MEWRWTISPEGIQMVRTGLAHCPQPDDAGCTCRVHGALRQGRDRLAAEMILGGHQGIVVRMTRKGTPRLTADEGS